MESVSAMDAGDPPVRSGGSQGSARSEGMLSAGSATSPEPGESAPGDTPRMASSRAAAAHDSTAVPHQHGARDGAQPASSRAAALSQQQQQAPSFLESGAGAAGRGGPPVESPTSELLHAMAAVRLSSGSVPAGKQGSEITPTLDRPASTQPHLAAGSRISAAPARAPASALPHAASGATSQRGKAEVGGRAASGSGVAAAAAAGAAVTPGGHQPAGPPPAPHVQGGGVGAAAPPQPPAPRARPATTADAIAQAKAAGCNLIVNYLPSSLTEAELRALFEEAGPTLKCKIVMNKRTHQSSGYGFVLFTRPEDAQTAIQRFDGLALRGKRLKVARARPQSADRQGANLFISSIHPLLDEQDLQFLFHVFGDIVESKILRDKKTGRSRCIGFVRYHFRADAQAAIMHLNGKQLPVPEAVHMRHRAENGGSLLPDMVTLLVKFAKDGVASSGQARGGRGNHAARGSRGSRNSGHHGGVPRGNARAHGSAHAHGAYPTTGFARSGPQHGYGAAPGGAAGDRGLVAYATHDASPYYRDHAMASAPSDVYGARGYLGGGSGGRGRRGPVPGRGAYEGDAGTGQDGSYATSTGMVLASGMGGVAMGHAVQSHAEHSLGSSGASTGNASGASTVSIDTRPLAGGVSMQRLFNPRGVQSPTVSIPVPYLPSSALSSAPAASMYWYNNSAGGMSPAHMSPHNAAMAAGAGVPTVGPMVSPAHTDYSMYGGMLYAASPSHLTPRAPVTYLSFDSSPPHVAAGGYSPMAFQYADAPLTYHQGGPAGLPGMGMGGWQDFAMHAQQQQLVSPAMHQHQAQQHYAAERTEPRRGAASGRDQ